MFYHRNSLNFVETYLFFHKISQLFPIFLIKFLMLLIFIGAIAIYSEALGSMPAKAAQGYLDNTFSRMMWFKTTSVYLTLNCGFHVLFQDADLIWLKNPFDNLININADISFMVSLFSIKNQTHSCVSIFS